jgi:hypothetical protein
MSRTRNVVYVFVVIMWLAGALWFCRFVRDLPIPLTEAEKQAVQKALPEYREQ